MFRSYTALVLALAVSFLSISAAAKCATGAVTVQGVVENLPSDTSRQDVTVVLHSSKGDFSKTGKLEGGKFTVEVPFPTLKSWSPLVGHNCSNLPKQVEVTVVSAGSIRARKTLRFKDNFETKDSLSYALKRELTIDAAEQHK